MRSTISAGSICMGKGTPKDAVQAARWLRLAANKGQRSAQAMLGSMLFKGEGVARQAAMGLVLADRRQGRRARTRGRRRLDHRDLSRAPSRRRPTTSARWPTAISKSGSSTRQRMSARERAAECCSPLQYDRSSRVDHDRHVVGRLFPGAHVPVDGGARPAGRRPAATAARGRCGCRCSSARRRPDNPRTCRGPGSSLPARTASVRPRLHSARNLSRVCGQE